MDYRFKADEWDRLTPEECAKRCRLLASEAEALAKNALPDMKAEYLRLADNWLRLAKEIERTILQDYSDH